MAKELKISRMDPMETYDAGAIAFQILDHQEKAKKLEIDAENFMNAAKTERKKATELEALLVKVRERDKTRKRAGG